MDEYELAGIETIARGICIREGRILLCRAKGGSTTYLPGGHIEFGATGREALRREMAEECALRVKVGAFRGALENSFMQHGRPHAEINLVYEIDFEDLPEGTPEVSSAENWIEFEWADLGALEQARLLPEAFRRLGSDPAAFFAC